jgi:hypothetical protein
MNGHQKRVRLHTTGAVLALDLQPVASVSLHALIGLGAVPDWIPMELNDRAWCALAAWRRFGAAIAKVPGLVVLPVLMAADDLAAAPAAMANGSAAEAGGAA